LSVQIIKMAPTNAERIMDLAEKMELVIQRLDLMNQNPSEIENGNAAAGRDAPSFMSNGLGNNHVVAEITEETAEVDGSDALSLSKLMGMVCKLKSDMSNFTNWESSLFNALDLIDVDSSQIRDMLEGRKRPSMKLNKIIRTIIHSSIDRDDKVLNSKIRPFLRHDIEKYKLNSGLAMLQTIRKYYYSQLENREDVLLRRLREFRFDGRNIVKYNSAYIDVYTELRDMDCVSGTKKEIKEYLDSLGTTGWTYDVRKAYEQMTEKQRTMENVMETAVQMFILRYSHGGPRNPDVQRPRNAFRAQHMNSDKERIKNCIYCTKSHLRGSCPAFGKDCSYCGQKNHFKKACKKLQTDLKNKKSQKETRVANRVGRVENEPVNDGNVLANENSQNQNLDLWALMVTKIDAVAKNGQKFLIDSGASASLTGDKDILLDYKETDVMYFATAGKEKLTVEGWGILELPTSFGNVKVKCGYSPKLPPKLTLVAVADLMQKDVTVQFGGKEKQTFLMKNGQKHYLQKHHDCFILNTQNETMESFTSTEEIIDTHEKWLNWHRRLGHASPTKMKQTLGPLIQLPRDLMVCRHCLEANVFVQSFEIHNAVIEEHGTSSFRLEPDVMYMDYKVLSEGYILHILYNGWLELFYLTTKTEARLKILEHLAGLHTKPRKIIADDDTPFNVDSFAETLLKYNIPIQLVPPLHHQLNSVEPRIRYTMEKIRAIILDLNILEEDREDLLELIVGYVSFVVNRIGRNPTPFEIRYGKPPDLKLMKPFFSQCVIPKLERRNNLSPKGMVVRFVGYERNALVPTCLLWNMNTGQLSRRAFIDCLWLLNPLNMDDEEVDLGDDDRQPYSETEPEEQPYLETEESQRSNVENDQHSDGATIDEHNKFSDWKHMNNAPLTEYGTNIENGLRRSKRLMINAVLTKEEIHYGHDLKRSSETVRRQFMLPIEAEVKNLQKHKVLEEINVPESYAKRHFRILNSQFILTQKRDGRLKARWVACGNQQTGLSDISTYAPTINRTLIFLLLKLALRFDLDIKTLDVSSAYLHGTLPKEEQVYIRAPYPLPPKIYKVVGNLYGLKQAGKVWNGIFTKDLEQFGLKASKLEPCLFYRLEPTPMFLLLHVDDGLILAREKDTETIIKYLQEKYEVTVDDGHDFLALGITRSRTEITVQQNAYVMKILAKYGFLDSKAADTPMLAQKTLELADPNEVIDDISEFQSLLGSLSFCRLTRPDLLFALHEMSSVASSPGQDALETVKRTFRYLKGTLNSQMRITKDEQDEWTCYVDASYAAGPERKSVGGHVIFIGKTPVLTHCATIKNAVDSSAHAEAYALYAAIRDILFLRNVLQELQLPVPKIRVLTDSKALVDFSFKSGSGKKSRHWDIVLHFMKNFIGSDRIMELSFISGQENVADIFTKSLGKELFAQHRAKLFQEPH
jgi:hypothetical protein